MFDNNVSFHDAMQANLAFAISQTAYVETQVYKLRYPDLNYEELVPVDNSAPEWIKTVTYYQMDGAGRARWISGNAKDIPVVGVNMGSAETSVYTAGIGYNYGYEEINTARMLGMNLDADKAAYARRAYEEMCYNVAFTGDTLKGFQGLYNYTGVPAASVAADGTGSSTLWANKTAALILRDINDLLTGVTAATNTVAMADTLILPYERLNYLGTQVLPNTTMTILGWLQANNVYTLTTGKPLKIVGQRGMLTIGSGSTARMIAYRRSPEVLKLHIPMRHRFLPVQVEGLQFTVPGIFRLGGLDIRLPKEVRYADGI